MFALDSRGATVLRFCVLCNSGSLRLCVSPVPVADESFSMKGSFQEQTLRMSNLKLKNSVLAARVNAKSAAEAQDEALVTVGGALGTGSPATSRPTLPSSLSSVGRPQAGGAAAAQPTAPAAASAPRASSSAPRGVSFTPIDWSSLQGPPRHSAAASLLTLPS